MDIVPSWSHSDVNGLGGGSTIFNNNGTKYKSQTDFHEEKFL